MAAKLRVKGRKRPRGQTAETAETDRGAQHARDRQQKAQRRTALTAGEQQLTGRDLADRTDKDALARD